MLILIDGHSIIYRAYHALGHLSTRGGEPTHAVYGFAAILSKILSTFPADYAGVAFDVAKKTFRNDLYKLYKANRKPMPDDLVSQIPLVKRLMDALKIPALELPDYEADDVMATLSRRAEREGEEVLLVSADKDLMQLIDGMIRLYHTTWEKIVTPDVVKEKIGLKPEQIVDYLALMGDASDNIPGVKGIGKVGARNLLTAWGSLDGVYGNLEKIKGSVRKKLEEGRDMALLSRDLVTLRDDLPLTIRLADLARAEPDTQSLAALYRELEFTSLLKGLSPSVQREKIVVTERDDDPPWGSFTECFLRVEEESVRLALPSGEIYRTSLEHFSPHFLHDDVTWVTHGAKSLFAAVGDPRSPSLPPVDDLEVMAYLLDPGKRTISLDDLAVTHGLQPDRQPPEVLIRHLAPIYREILEREGLMTLYEEIERPLIPILQAMERRGVVVDVEVLRSLQEAFARHLGALEEEIFTRAGHPFNIQSPKQLREVLYGEMGIKPTGKKTSKTKQFSTGEQALKELIARGETFPKLILAYREFAKLKGTYLDPLPALLDSEGRLHTTLNQTVTATGRLSSSNPNLQNIPIRTEHGRRIRKAFTVPEGYLFIDADYSQIELRLLAHFSQDPVLLDAFHRGADIHTATASTIYHLPEEEITKEMRRRAKTINFGILYGMSPHGLSLELGIPQGEAKEMIDTYFSTFPRVKGTLEEILQKARQTRIIRTIMGRLRRIPEIMASNYAIRSNAERMAVNAPLQGSAADIIKKAMIVLFNDLIRKEEDLHMVLQVHDELLFEVREERAEVIKEKIRTIMEGVVRLSVPLKVDIGTGRNWGEIQ